MFENQSFISKKWVRNTAVLLIATAAATLIAIFVFDVAKDTAVSYSLLGLFFVSHLFMHGSHGGHGHDHADHTAANDADHSVEPRVTEEQLQ